MAVLQILALVMALAVVVTIARIWLRASAPRKAAALGPHAMFDGGERYATADERMRIETDGPSAAGEGVLTAIVEALRARGAGTNAVEPETYGYMTVVEIDGEDIILELASGGDRDWLLLVKAPSGKVPLRLMEALRSLDGVRNVTWTI